MDKEEKTILGVPYKKFHDFVERELKEKSDLKIILLQNIADGEYIAECEGILGQKVVVLISAKKHDKDVTREDLENFLLLMNMNKVDLGFFITQTDFTEEAKFFARDHSIKLLSGEELSHLLESAHIEETREKFAIGDPDNEVKEKLNNRRRSSFFGLFGSETKPTIEKKARPVGLFTLKSKHKEEESKVYVDLTTAEIYCIEGRRISRENSLKKILELPEDARKLLLDFMPKKTFDYDAFPKKELSILEKNGFVKVKTTEQGFLLFLTDEILWGIRIITDIFGEFLNMKPSRRASSMKVTSKKYVVLNFKPIKFKKQHDLELYLEKSSTITKEFHPDEKKYGTEEIKNVLSKVSNAEVSFCHVVYLPYYEGTYKNKRNFRKEQIFPVRFKYHTESKQGSYNAIYHFIDKAPEVPFLFLALMYAAYIYPNWERIAHVFYSSLVFVFALFAIGLLLKYVFKTDRKVQYTNAPIVRYGFPLLHSLISVGTIAFVYFIPDIGPFMSLLLIPLGFLYIYSRIKLRVHSLTDVIGGAIIGLLFGAVFGYYLLYRQLIQLPFEFKIVFTILFFILPVFSVWYRMKTGYVR